MESGSITSPAIAQITTNHRTGFVLFGMVGPMVVLTHAARKNIRLWRKMETLISDLEEQLESKKMGPLIFYPHIEDSPLAPFQDKFTQDD